MPAPIETAVVVRVGARACLLAALSQLTGCPGPAREPVVPRARSIASAVERAHDAPAATLLAPRYPRNAPYGSPSFSADGARVATVHEGRAYVVDLRDGPGRSKGDVHGPFAERAGWPEVASLSPDGARLAVLSSNDRGHDLVVSDVATGTRLFVLRDAEGAQFVAGGRALLTALGRPNRKPVVVDSTTGEVLRTFGNGRASAAGDYATTSEAGGTPLWDTRNGVRLTTLARDAKVGASQGSTHAWLEGGLARAFDVSTARPIPLSNIESCPGVSVAVDRGGRTVGVVASNGDLCLWDVPSGALRRVPWKGPPPRTPPTISQLSGTGATMGADHGTEYVDTTTNTVITEAEWQAREALAVSDDGRLGVVFEPRAVVEMATGKRLFAIEGERPTFAPDALSVAVRSPRFGLELVDTRSGATLLQALPRALPIDHVTGTPDGLGLVSVPSWQETGVVLDVGSLTPLRLLPRASIAPSSGLSLLRPPGADPTVLDSQESSQRTVHLPRGRMSATAVSPDGRWVVAATYDETRPPSARDFFTVLSTSGGAPREIPNRVRSIPSSLGVTADGKLVVAIWLSVAVGAWDVDTGKSTVGRLMADRVIVLPSSHRAVLLGPGVTTIDLGTGQAELVGSLSVRNPAGAASRDGKLLAVGGDGTWATLFDLERGTARYLEDSADVEPGTFSSDGTLVYGRGPDGIGAWRVQDGASLWLANPLGTATLLRGRDGKMEIVGEAHAAAEALSCVAGARVVPLAACRNALSSPGVIRRALATPLRPGSR